MTTSKLSRFAMPLSTLTLALAASQAGATTYSVPLQFNLSLTGPVCSLTVGSATADATTPVHATGVSINLSPTPLSVSMSPVALIGSLPGTVAYSADAPGYRYEFVNTPNARRLTSMPAASATCTSGTPMNATLTKGVPGTLFGVGLTEMMAGQPGSGQSGTLPVGMAMGIASFGSVTGVVGHLSTTIAAANASISTTANGTAQSLALTAMVAALSTTVLSSSYAGDWYYPFTVNLNF